MRQLVLFVLVSIIALLATLFFRLGGHKPVLFTEGEHGPWIVISKQHFGAYHKIVPVLEEVEAWVKRNGDTCRLTFGEYIDNPEEVDEGRLRSNAGCVLKRDPASLTSPLPEGYSVRELARRNFLVATFDGAPSIGPLKVYPQAHKLIAEKSLVIDGPIVEMYELIPDQRVRTTYYFPVKPR